MNRSRPSALALALGLVIASGPETRAGDGSLNIPRSIDGYPTNVGLLFLGHSTSAQGLYPAKLVATLNDPSNSFDRRHYQAVTAITSSDGGLLWSLVSAGTTDARYDRLTASAGVGESSQPQWCEDATGTRWSCRRAKLDHVLTGVFSIPTTGGCADPTVASGCRAANTLACTWYDRSLPLAQNPVTQNLSPSACWLKMDYHLALIQDTTNRSWPVDDYQIDGVVADGDLWPAPRIRSRALPCLGTPGVVGPLVDWSCDGQLGADDAPHRVYAGWLAALSTDLLDEGLYGDAALDAVFLGHKPVELGQCLLWPPAERPTCLANPHAVRTTEQITSTPDRPFDRYFLPTVYWEQQALVTLFADQGLDPRIHPATMDDGLAMWRASERCYTLGQSEEQWRIPDAVGGRPTSIESDDSEADGGPTPNADAVGCMVADHVHHNEAGGWLMADVWYAGLLPRLVSGLFTDGFETGDTSAWTLTSP